MSKRLQQALTLLGYYHGNIDGIVGPQTLSAATLILAAHKVNMPGWENARKLMAAEQAALNDLGIPAGTTDGLVGPSTLHAQDYFDEWQATGKKPGPWRTDGTAASVSVAPAAQSLQWPSQNYADMVRFYGEVGKNQVQLAVPYDMKLAWDLGTPVKWFSCHEKIHDVALKALSAVADAYSAAERAEHGLDLFGGCLNVRQMRGGTAWSMHSWGIAIDFDPLRNQLKWGRDQAHMALPALDKFRKIWTNLGAVSLGEARNYDWMHFQFARI